MNLNKSKNYLIQFCQWETFGILKEGLIGRRKVWRLCAKCDYAFSQRRIYFLPDDRVATMNKTARRLSNTVTSYYFIWFWRAKILTRRKSVTYYNSNEKKKKKNVSLGAQKFWWDFKFFLSCNMINYRFDMLIILSILLNILFFFSINLLWFSNRNCNFPIVVAHFAFIVSAFLLFTLR